MATNINPETVKFVQESLTKHGFEHALQRCSVDCVAAGMDADDFTYQVVALFVSFILARSMDSHSQSEEKFKLLQANVRAFNSIVANVAMQLSKQLDQLRAEEQQRERDKAMRNAEAPADPTALN